MSQGNDNTPSEMNKSKQDKEKLSLMSGIALLIGSIIGSGIFISPRGVLLGTGSYGLSVLIWILSGLICIPGCLCYAELGTMIHSSGGDYTYIKIAFGDCAAFLRIWCEICCVRPAIIAVCAITAAVYLLQPIYTPCSPDNTIVICLACFFILIIALLNLLSTRGSIIWQNIAFYGKISALAFVIGLGLYQICRGHSEVFREPFAYTDTSVQKISIALYIGLYPYSGWNYLSNAIEELKNPTKNFPIAIMSSIIASTVLYVLAYSAYFTSLSPLEVSKAEAVAVSFAENIYQPFGIIMPILVSISALGGLNGQIFSIVRMFSVAGRDGLMPTVSSFVHIKRSTPIVPILIEGFLGIIYVLIGDADRLLGYLSFNTWLVCLFGAASVFVIRRKMPDVPRPFNAGNLSPIIFTVAMSVLSIINLIYNPIDILVGFLILISGWPVYYIFVVNRSPTIDKLSRKILVLLQKLLLVVPPVSDHNGDK